MSSVSILTPIVIGSWPSIAAAVLGAAGAMGFTVAATTDRADPGDSVETELANSQVLSDLLARGEEVTIVKDGVTIRVGVDTRGKCRVCASGVGHSKAALRQIGQQVAGRIVQQFAYHKLMTELKTRGFRIEHESVAGDNSIQVRVRAET
jgi:hypothetical protein